MMAGSVDNPLIAVDWSTGLERIGALRQSSKEAMILPEQ